MAGVGVKTAVRLLNEYGTLESALDHADDVKNKRAREGLQNCREEAVLSQELVTLKTDMDINADYKDMVIDGFNVNAMDEIFRELEFQALQKQLNTFYGEVPTPEKRPEKNYLSILNKVDLDTFVKDIKKDKWLSFDLETTSVEPMLCEIVGLSFSTQADSGVYIPIQYNEKESNNFGGEDLTSVLEILKPVFENKSIPKTGQNVKFDALILKRPWCRG
ncbi:MAG: hypothetical protein Ct9H300mP29_3670 [Candidatus Neomarinimicrobiota bacterium]|nr:MAG: hypothetical protein Ct9H300mP29_3670 [Candidatus Neomarinimicrobiota bacterium]